MCILVLAVASAMAGAAHVLPGLCNQCHQMQRQNWGTGAGGHDEYQGKFLKLILHVGGRKRNTSLQMCHAAGKQSKESSGDGASRRHSMKYTYKFIRQSRDLYVPTTINGRFHIEQRRCGPHDDNIRT